MVIDECMNFIDPSINIVNHKHENKDDLNIKLTSIRDNYLPWFRNTFGRTFSDRSGSSFWG